MKLKNARINAEFTFFIWVKPDSGQSNDIQSIFEAKSETDATFDFGIKYDSSADAMGMFSDISGDRDYPTSFDVDLDAWNHLVWVCEYFKHPTYTYECQRYAAGSLSAPH